MDFPGFLGDPRDGPTAQAARWARVGLDAVAELYRFGRPRHAPDGGGSMQVVTQLPGVQGFPPAPLVAHDHDIGSQ